MGDKAHDLQMFINKHLPETINKEYQTPENLENNEDTALGTAISIWTEWDGKRIMQVFFEALEDANFHTEAREVQHWIELIEGGYEKHTAYWKRQEALHENT